MLLIKMYALMHTFRHCTTVRVLSLKCCVLLVTLYTHAASSSYTKPVLQDLDPLSTLPKLQHLSLLDNPVTKQPNYRCDLTWVHTTDQ